MNSKLNLTKKNVLIQAVDSNVNIPQFLLKIFFIISTTYSLRIRFHGLEKL